ncbi:MAG: Stp1/IreP family PP2C-type Ser/Thr phosphatase [Candidatus Acidiferrales bacterium]
MEFGARSEVGQVRENNEDSFGLVPELNLFVLSDGMGGLEAGERASRLAVETVITHCRDAAANPELAVFGSRIEGVCEASNRLASAVRLANQVIYEAAQELGGRGGMGATIVAVLGLEDRLCIAHVGDSRAYLLRKGQFDQLTEDHSFVAEQLRRGILTPEEAGRSKMQNVLTRALGVDRHVEVDVTEELVVEDDVYLLCSDGLFHELSEQQIAGVLAEATGAQQAADRVVELANQAGGGDNITAIVLRYAPKQNGALSKIGRWFKGAEDPS